MIEEMYIPLGISFLKGAWHLERMQYLLINVYIFYKGVSPLEGTPLESTMCYVST